MPIDYMSVAQASRRLGVNQARVRAMVYSGQLVGQKLSGRWLIDPASVERRQHAIPSNGRPLSINNAWGLLWIAAGRCPAWLSAPALSRIRRRLREQGIVPQIPRLGHRAVLRRFRCHRSDVERIARDRRTIQTGISAARQLGVPLIAQGQSEVYLRAEDFSVFVEQFALIPDPSRGNVTLRVVSKLWPFDGEEPAPDSVVGVDLADSMDHRTAREGRALLERLEATWSI